MAYIEKNKFHKIQKDRSSKHKTVTASYSIFEIGNKKYFQIDTYGSEDRMYKEKMSQTIQIDEEMVRELIQIFEKEFKL